MYIFPDRIKKGDKIGIIAPSNLIDEDDKDAIASSKKMFEDARIYYRVFRKFFKF